MLPIDEFENAVIKFGVESALEYFATPFELHHLWNDEWSNKVIAKNYEKVTPKALDISEYLRSGWICPICKMVNSPNSSVCACMPLPKFESKE